MSEPLSASLSACMCTIVCKCMKPNEYHTIIIVQSTPNVICVLYLFAGKCSTIDAYFVFTIVTISIDQRSNTTFRLIGFLVSVRFNFVFILVSNFFFFISAKQIFGLYCNLHLQFCLYVSKINIKIKVFSFFGNIFFLTDKYRFQ